MNEKLNIKFPSQGWSQIATARKEMLDSYDRARAQSRGHEVETFHGKVAEGCFREWLKDFLPKRYGVTSGYVISSGLKSSDKAPHFDVIIYDQLEAPILWIESNPDASLQGRSMAIPVEYVCAVLEVKSSFSSRTVKESLDHLKDLAPVMNGLDEPNERYRVHLPPNFCCASVFFEMRKDEDYSEAALAALVNGSDIRGFFGGIVLRAESISVPHSGRLGLVRSETALESTVSSKQTAIWEFGMSKSVEVAEKVHIGSMARWSEAAFAEFAFDLIAMIQGTYEVGRVSSFYGMGNSFAEMASDLKST